MVARAPAIGIDLGTSYACVGVFQHNKVEIIPNDYGNKTTPSYVGFTATHRFIGNAAKLYQEFVKTVPTPSIEDTIFDAKRLIGCHFHDQFVQDQIKHWPFTVVDNSGNPYINIQVDYMGKINKTFSPEEILAMVLVKMKETAESHLGLIVTDAVISVPASFNNRQRQTVMDAAAIVKLKVLGLINEPTAAAIAYSLDDKINEKRNVLIFDLGGGSLDVSILTLANSTVKVKATAGDFHLGGEDFDNLLVDHFVQEIKEKHKIEIASNKCALRRLRTECEKAKRTLSSSTEAFIKFELIDPKGIESIDFDTSISCERFEELCGDLFNRISSTLQKLLQDPMIRNVQIDDIVLVGGSSHIPKVQKLVQKFFNVTNFNKFRFIDVNEAVAYGAAVLAAKLQGDESDAVQYLKVSDVAPFSLRIETAEGKTEVVIHRSSSIPTEMTPYVCTTSNDYQASITINVYEDDDNNNNLLGKFVLSGILPARHGVPHIEIRLVIDSNGILTVSAVDKSSGCEKHLAILSEIGRPSKKEIERMMNNAQRYRSEDEKERERIAIKSTFESYCLKVRNMLRDENSKDNFSDADKKTILNKCNEIDKWQQNNLSKGLLPSKEEFQQKLKDLECLCIPNCNIEDKKEKDRVAAINSLKSYCSQIDILVDTNIMDVDREKKVMKKLDDITCWLNANPSANKEEIDLKRKDLELTAIQHTVADFTKLEATRSALNALPESDYTHGYKAFRCVIGEKISYFMNKQIVSDLSLGHATSLKLRSLLDLSEGSQNIPLYGEPYKLDRAPWNDMVGCIMEKSKLKREYRNEQNSDLTDLEKLKGMGLVAAEVIKNVLSPNPAENLFRGFLQSLDSLKTLDFSIKSERGLIEQKQHSDEIKKIGTVIIASFEYKFTCHSSCNVGSEKSQVKLSVHSQVWEFPTISDMKNEYFKLTHQD